ncbi:MAG: hypothetical protein U0930_04895 [Pirellulales bacterium]
MTTKSKRGRKPTGKTPVRQVGRIRTENWKIIRRGFDVSGERKFTAWAEKVLLEAANREMRNFTSSNKGLVRLVKSRSTR